MIFCQIKTLPVQFPTVPTHRSPSHVRYQVCCVALHLMVTVSPSLKAVAPGGGFTAAQPTTTEHKNELCVIEIFAIMGCTTAIKTIRCVCRRKQVIKLDTFDLAESVAQKVTLTFIFHQKIRQLRIGWQRGEVQAKVVCVGSVQMSVSHTSAQS